MAREWLVSKGTDLGRTALKYKIWQYLTKHSIGLTEEQMKRVVFINESYQPLSNPCLSSMRANEIKTRLKLR